MSHSTGLEPVGRRGSCPEGETLLACARLMDVGLARLCGGISGCGQSAVQTMNGDVSEPTPEDAGFLGPDAISQGYCVACRAVPLADSTVRVSLESLTCPQRTRLEREESVVAPEATGT